MAGWGDMVSGTVTRRASITGSWRRQAARSLRVALLVGAAGMTIAACDGTSPRMDGGAGGQPTGGAGGVGRGGRGGDGMGGRAGSSGSGGAAGRGGAVGRGGNGGGGRSASGGVA